MNRTILGLALLTPLALLCQDPPAPTPPTGGPPSGAPAGFPGRGAASSEPEIKPYDKVITKDAKSSDGLFKVHRIKSKVYYEIPKSQLEKDMLWVSQLAKTTLGAGYGGSAVGNRVVRWERKENRVLLRDISYEVVADEKEPISRAVKAANTPTVLMAFNIEAIGKEDAPVIEVTRLFTSEVPEFSARRTLRARGFDSSRTFIEGVRAFPENINVEVMQTYTSPPEMSSFGSSMPTPPPSPFAGGMKGNNATVVMHYSMVKLPEKPMMPRLADKRLGYFAIQQSDYGVNEHKAADREYITRWRLEKKDPSAAVSEPIKPIVYYIDPATPKQWVSYVRKGIEDWQPAFEKAGFRRAIIAKDAPSPAEDPNWSPEDARVSCVRWLPSKIANAMGPHVHDPRTGEILESDIMMFHNILELQRDWYFSQVAPLDPRAQKLPMPDDLMGELIRFVVAHEVGHTLGLPHNMKASSNYPFEKVRDREWLAKMGHTPTIMDYSRFNYVVQPEDKVPAELLIPRIGPYDDFSIMWGYKPVDGAKSPEDEKKTLNEWLKPQETTPWLRFSTSNSMGSDPGELTEAVGDADAVLATTLGTKNIKRVMGLLLNAVAKPGEDYSDLNDVYGAVVGQWTRELNHVAALVGGFDSQQKHGGQPGVLFTPIAKERQKAAVKFLNTNLFATPAWLVPAEIERRLAPMGALNRVLNAQRGVLSNLMSAARMARLMEQEAVDGVKSYRASEFLADVREGVFTELSQPATVIDPWRRNLQRAYLELVNDRLNGRATPAIAMGARSFSIIPLNPNDDARGLLRAELRSIAAQIATKNGSITERATRAHLDDMKDRIAQILDPKVTPASPASSITMGRPTVDQIEEWMIPQEWMTCWPNLSILP
ncbi:MAG: zinc-dependent metalloprotease [Bryobacterales bacterium]|nr:zinc-dependent metalloprotease [Bryobacterales bacterium]